MSYIYVGMERKFCICVQVCHKYRYKCVCLCVCVQVCRECMCGSLFIDIRVHTPPNSNDNPKFSLITRVASRHEC